MTLNLTIPQTLHTDFTPRITVIGVGGGGTNAVDNMIASNLQGVDFVVANTDAQQLMHSRSDRRIQLGPHLTQGLGAGAKPEIGRAAAEEAADELARHLDGAHMVFITAGMGGGTGTGAAPVIARMARERGILTVGVVTKPFTFEGVRRAKAAEAGITELQAYVDTLIVIPNQNLFRLANERTGWKEAFKMADHVLYMGVRGVTDLMVAPGLVNLDFADIRTVMAEMGKAMMGTGEAEGENRAIRAAEAAISNPLLEDTSMSGARGLLINITGGEDMTLFEVDAAANRIREEVAEDANIIFGSAVDENLSGRVRVSVVATGIDSPEQLQHEADMARPKLVAVGGAQMPMPSMPMVAMTPMSEMQEQGGTVTPLPGARAPMGAPQQAPQQGYAAPFGAPVSAPMHGPVAQQGHAQHAHAQHAHAQAQHAQAYAEQPAFAPVAAQMPPAMMAQPSLAPQQRMAPLPTATPRSGGLFNEAPRQATAPVEAAPVSAASNPSRNLFRAVTGALRRAPAAAPVQQAEAPRAEHGPAPRVEPTAAVRATPTDEMGLDIPAFLRRQSS